MLSHYNSIINGKMLKRGVIMQNDECRIKNYSPNFCRLTIYLQAPTYFVGSATYLLAFLTYFLASFTSELALARN